MQPGSSIPRRVLVPLAVGLLLAVLTEKPAGAKFVPDSVPPVTWEQLVKCELVVVGKYVKHEKRKLSLKVTRVLRGKGVRKGNVLAVELQHAYGVGTAPDPFSGIDRRKPKKVPKLYYGQIMANYFGLGVIIPDLGQEVVYFLPKAASPVLKHRGQVQPAKWADQWERALAGRPTDVLFRLTQGVSGRVHREALDELYEKRDPKALKRLFAWVLSPPKGLAFDCLYWEYLEPFKVLSAVGDREGDVYDPLMKLLRSRAAGTGEYRFYRIVHVLCAADPDRAFRDFSSVLEKGQPEDRALAAYAMCCIPDERALKLAFRLLRDRDKGVAATAAGSLCHFAAGRSFTRRDWWRLMEKARPLYRSAAADRRISGALRKWLREWTCHFLRPKSAAGLYREISREVLKPPGDEKGFNEALRRGLGHFWLKDEKVLRRFAPVLKKKAREAIKGRWMVNEQLPYLLHRVDPKAAEKLVEGAIADREKFAALAPYLRAQLLAASVRFGKAERIEEFLKACEQTSAERRRLYGERSAHYYAHLLLRCGHPKALAEYLKVLDGRKRCVREHFSHQEILNQQYVEFLPTLFPDHPKEFLDRVLLLLDSDSEPLRRGGEEVLKETLFWNFNLRWDDFKSVRAKKLAGIKVAFKKLEKASGPEVRAHVLRHLGVKLEGKPSRKWVPTLVQAAASSDPSIHKNALRLLEEVAGAHGCFKLHYLTPAERSKLLPKLLKTRGISLKRR